jgi:hypothetical protein
VNTSLGIRVPDNANRLTRSFPGARIGLSSLAANGQAAQMPNAPVALDTLQAFKIHTQLATEITFDHVLPVLDGMDDLGDLLFVQVLGAERWINLGFLQDEQRIHRANAVDIAQGDIDPLLSRNINT